MRADAADRSIDRHAREMRTMSAPPAHAQRDGMRQAAAAAAAAAARRSACAQRANLRKPTAKPEIRCVFGDRHETLQINVAGLYCLRRSAPLRAASRGNRSFPVGFFEPAITE